MPGHGRISGTIVDWHDDRGFGFIRPEGERRKVFVHVSDVASGRRPEAGDLVTFRMGRDERGRACAVGVRLAGADPRPSAPPPSALVSALVAVTVLAAVAALAYVDVVPPPVPIAVAVLNLVTFLVYAGDKAAAVERRQRVPESTLHLLALAGGWPGALVARHALRHKTRKQPFRAFFWCTVAVNTAVVTAAVVLTVERAAPWS